MTPQIRAIANLTALAELLKPDPDPDVLAHYEGWADARVRNQVFDIIGVVKPEHRALFDRLAFWDCQAERTGARVCAALNIHHEALLNAGALTAYFTPLPICESMWQIALRALRRPLRTIIEPSAGTGRFLASQPVLDTPAQQRLAIEPDPVFSRILQHRFPPWSVRATTLEAAGLQNPCADLIIGNAPFGDWGVADTHAPPMLRHKYLQAKVHDYFVCKSVSLLNPGGVVAMITHNSTMDREEVGVREWLNEHAELVAAYRLPANLWEGQGAAPVSDVLVMRRRG